MTYSDQAKQQLLEHKQEMLAFLTANETAMCDFELEQTTEYCHRIIDLCSGLNLAEEAKAWLREAQDLLPLAERLRERRALAVVEKLHRFSGALNEEAKCLISGSHALHPTRVEIMNSILLKYGYPAITQDVRQILISASLIEREYRPI